LNFSVELRSDFRGVCLLLAVPIYNEGECLVCVFTVFITYSLFAWGKENTLLQSDRGV
jgi:hypothetical protein